MPKISKLINVFKSCVGKGSNTKECKSVPDVFHDLCVSINNSLNSKNNKDVSFDTVDSPENKSILHHVTDLADLKEL